MTGDGAGARTEEKVHEYEGIGERAFDEPDEPVHEVHEPDEPSASSEPDEPSEPDEQPADLASATADEQPAGDAAAVPDSATPDAAAADRAASDSAAPSPAAPDLTEPLLPPESFLDRWSDIQVSFIEDPHRSVFEADALLTTLLKAYQEAVENRRAQISANWTENPADTEKLRLALLDYRAVIIRMLET